MSWQQYITIIGFATAVYYIVVFALYFRRDLVKLRGRQVAQNRQNVKTEHVTHAKSSDPGIHSAVHDLMEELKQVMYNAKRFDYPKEEVMMALEVTLRDYKQLKDAPVRDSIMQHIRSESKSIGCELTDIDIKNLWNI